MVLHLFLRLGQKPNHCNIGTTTSASTTNITTTTITTNRLSFQLLRFSHIANLKVTWKRAQGICEISYFLDDPPVTHLVQRLSLGSDGGLSKGARKWVTLEARAEVGWR